MDKRIEEVEKCQDFEKDTLMVHLRYGWRHGDEGCHTFGADNMREVRTTMKHVQPCRCSECRKR